MLGVDLVEGEEFVVADADVQARGVGRDSPVAAAQQAPERFTGRLCLDVPQGGVECADGAEHGAGVARLEGLPQHAVVERRHAARVFAVDGGEYGVEFHVRPEADAGDPLIGVHHDDRHRDVPVGVDAVGVTDGAAPFMHRRESPIPRNPHVSPSWSRR